MKAAAYLARQSLRMLRGNIRSSVLLFLCLTTAFFVPVVLDAYQQGELNRFSSNARITLSDHELSLDLRIPYAFDQQPLDRPEDIESFLTSTGYVGGAAVLYRVASRFVWFEGAALSEPAFWAVVPKEGTRLRQVIPDGRILYGENLKQPGDVLVGDSVATGVPARSLVGRAMQINGKDYIICGVIERYDGIYAAAQEGPTFSEGVLYFWPDGDSREAADLLAAALEEHFVIQRISFAQEARNEGTAYTLRKTTEYIWMSYGVYSFCFACCLGVVHFLLFGSRRTMRIKLSLGATRGQVTLEFFLYFLLLSLLAAASALALSRPADLYFRHFTTQPLLLSAKTYVILAGLSLASSLVVSFAFAWKEAGKLS